MKKWILGVAFLLSPLSYAQKEILWKDSVFDLSKEYVIQTFQETSDRVETFYTEINVIHGDQHIELTRSLSREEAVREHHRQFENAHTIVRDYAYRKFIRMRNGGVAQR